nr:hypothetical protein [uncultured Pseudodesulfovibrio sp.]
MCSGQIGFMVPDELFEDIEHALVVIHKKDKGPVDFIFGILHIPLMNVRNFDVASSCQFAEDNDL